MSEDQKSPVDQALDLFVFAPIGLLSLARQQLPQLVERGRQQVQGQMAMAKFMGEYAVQQGRKEAEKAVRDVVDRVRPATPPAPAGPGPAPRAERPAEPSPTPDPAPAASGVEGSPAAAGNGSAPARPAAEPAPAAHTLAIPGYDALSASQVVARLAGLAAEELEAVRAYETAGRGRRTILNKISQLQSAPR